MPYEWKYKKWIIFWTADKDRKVEWSWPCSWELHPVIAKVRVWFPVKPEFFQVFFNHLDSLFNCEDHFYKCLMLPLSRISCASCLEILLKNHLNEKENKNNSLDQLYTLHCYFFPPIDSGIFKTQSFSNSLRIHEGNHCHNISADWKSDLDYPNS